MKTNKDYTVKQSVQGEISHPKAGRLPYRLDREGKGRNLPGTGGITYNVRVGDSAMGWAGDHIEPAVSMKITDKSKNNENYGLGLLACIGNEAQVVSGEAEGAKGVVTGLHGGINHVLVDFSPADMEKMKIGDSILVKAWGQGFELEEYPELRVFNLDPDLFAKLDIEEDKEENKLKVPVAAIVPGHLMGSGIGSSTAAMGDYDITTGDKEELARHNLTDLRLGDFVYLADCDNTYGREYISGAGSIGVISHSDCIIMGHGPGVTTIMTSKKDTIKPELVEEANLVNYLDLR